MFGDTISEDMACELEKSERMKKKIRYFTEEMEEKA